MKFSNTEDSYLHDELERLDSSISDSCKKQIREEKRKLKKRMSKNRRNTEKRQLQSILKNNSDEN